MADEGSLVIPQTLLVKHVDGYIEEMPLEEYVKGVVPTYLGLPVPMEALKALAISVRSEAVTARRHARERFDLCATDHCMVWRPANRYPDSDRAVDQTAGQVLVLNGRIVAAPFFEHCDGRTRDAEEVWATPMRHCRSVSCTCGFSQLLGHGVGLCQRGAISMARGGSTAQEILKHYFSLAEVRQGRATARAEIRQSVIIGRIVDDSGQPCPGLRLLLRGDRGAVHKTTGSDGRFWFTGLPEGQWELVVKGKEFRQTGLRTSGRDTLEIEVAVPNIPQLVAEVVPLAHPKRLIGTLGYGGVPVTLVDRAGGEQTVLSGSAQEFDPGGFALPLPPPGSYSLLIAGQAFPLEVGDTGLWIRFGPRRG